jgi:hypothetical protein
VGGNCHVDLLVAAGSLGKSLMHTS